MRSKPRTPRAKAHAAQQQSPLSPAQVLMLEFPGLPHPAAHTVAAKVLRAATAPKYFRHSTTGLATRINATVDSLLERIRSVANNDIVDELYAEIEDYGKDEYDGGYHEGYDRGCEDTEPDA